MPNLRFLSVVALCVAFAPLTLAQSAAPPAVDCTQIPLSEGPADPAYASCAQEAPDAPALRFVQNAPNFGHDYQREAFVSFAEDRPQVYNIVAPFDPTLVNEDNFVNAGDFRGNDLATWYGLDRDGRAFSVDANAGTITPLGRIAPPDGFTWTALTWDYEDRVFYALTANCPSETALFTVDFDALTATQVSPANQGLLCGVALASDPTDGTLYAYGLARNELVTVDKSNGLVTTIGSLNFDPNYGQEMDFNNIDGTLLAYAYNNDNLRGELRVVNKNTGRTTLIGRLGSASSGGSQIGAGSSRTPRLSFSVTASVADRTVAQGGTAVFSYQVCNGTPAALSGDLTYQVFRNGDAVTGAEFVASGLVDAASCLSEQSFSLDIPSDALTGGYIVEVKATSDLGNIPMTASLPVTVEASAAPASVAAWAVSGATLWPEAAVSASVSAAPGEIAAFPNPFTAQTSLGFSLAEAAEVRLAVYDVLGREVAVLVDGPVEAGAHAATFEARGLASGTYVYRLVAGDVVQSGRITLMN